MIYRSLENLANKLAGLSPVSMTSLYIVLAVAAGMFTVLLVPATGVKLLGWFLLGAIMGPAALIFVVVAVALLWLLITDGRYDD